ncbi:MAG: hemin uptake protein HemP [Sutterellaceae bacterium]|nr:hemin uptake protein HemP [Burkholderiaceae bacterium]MCX7901694.1 hemin uptake protein HemP [Burkholderiaceae bacterium]MDW8429101.1 hemin uptake protein HemP [Sutterellaceae bacterium]
MQVDQMEGERRVKSAAPRAAAQEESGGPRLIDSATLLGNQQLVRIRHGSGIYTLRQTRQGKLILTK